MLKQETKDSLKKHFKIDVDALIAAIKDEAEVDFTVDDTLTVVTDKEIAAVKQKGYNEGKIAGEEMAVDEVKKEMSLSYEGKSVKALAKEVAKKTLADAKIEPEKKVTELQEKLTEVQKNYTDLEKKLQEKDGEVENIKSTTELSKHVPANSTLPSEKVLGLMRMDGFEFKRVEGKLVPFKDGKEIVDKLGNAREVKDILAEYVTTNKLAPETPGGGRGGGDNPGGGGAGVFTKLSEIKESFAKQNKSTLGQEFAKAVEEAAKVEGFEMNA